MLAKVRSCRARVRRGPETVQQAKLHHSWCKKTHFDCTENSANHA